ncbi:hypothetical protein GCM10022251_26430 [Phytohabitans flavus]|uniref:Uncharacterized protein n=1 Tax=Phytohabitans flavus TaxID=1076124 RepID=A0A6F8XPU1_9ACTN|nr:hypothetical protein [Phytohabitans flavus]BCB75761.1 hypothetical protein Pflav_021710 [Phytohabitans flavus]
MPDAVWLTAHPRPTSSRNGFGRELKGFTRPDATGRRFATCWFVAFGLPIVPLSRCYLSEDRPRETWLGATARYRIEGESRLRAAEVLRTYAFGWLLVPAVLIAPALVLLSQADRVIDDEGSDVAKLSLVGAFLLVLLGSILALGVLRGLYRQRWAPVREVVWVDAPVVPSGRPAVR